MEQHSHASEVRLQAFVAMRFSTDPWRDRTYQVIKGELELAGYSCVRGDEIETSGPPDEVCRLLREADLVIIDSSGDSLSVAYEIGFCHGAARPHNVTLLLRSDATIPFNYRHYRHRVYRDLRHLRRLVRSYLALNEPLGLDEYGYSFSFMMADEAGFGYIKNAAHQLFNVLRRLKFSGRCECYSAEVFGDRRFIVGLMLRPSRGKKTPSYGFWKDACSDLEENWNADEQSFRFDDLCSELAEKRAMLAHLLPCGVAEFEQGAVVRVLGPPEDLDASFFRSYLLDRDGVT